jgi:hypothetical protein
LQPSWLFLAAGAMGQHNFPVRNFWVTLVKLLNENLLSYVLLITFER